MLYPEPLIYTSSEANGFDVIAASSSAWRYPRCPALLSDGLTDQVGSQLPILDSLGPPGHDESRENVDERD